MTAHLTEIPAVPSTVARIPIPAVLDTIVMKALEKDMNARFQTAKEFDALLNDVANLPESAIRIVSTPEQRSARPRNLELVNSTDTAFEVPIVSNTPAPSAPSRPFLVMLFLLSAVTVFIGGWFLLFARHGGP
jgi:hypothetical protein